MQLEDIDLTQLPRFGGDMPDEWFTFLRREAPVWYHPHVEGVPELDGEGFWVLTKYADIVPANRDWRHFSAETGPGRDGAGGITIGDVTEPVASIMLMTDPPRQQRMRRFVNQGFSPRGVRRLENYARELCGRLFDAVVPRGECEFVDELAAELPLQVIAEILGVPESDRHDVFKWLQQVLDSKLTPEEQRAAAVSLYGYAHQLAEKKRRNPTDDIFSAVVHAELPGEDGEPERLSDLEVMHFFQLIGTGGSETTRNALSGGLLALMEFPAELERLRADRSLLHTAAEEILRWTSPVNYFRRTATRDVEVRGEKIRAGQKVTLWYCSANRDDEVFRDPFRFDVGRWPNYHLAFGAGGPHYCLGANLAKMEIEVFLDEMLRRMTDFEVAGEVERFYTRWDINVFGGYQKLPIRFRAL